MQRQTGLRRRLEATRAEVVRLRDELAIVDEQLAYLRGVADDATLRALVASTPLADRERRERAADLERLRRYRGELVDRLAEALGEQDRTLDRLLEVGGRR